MQDSFMQAIPIDEALRRKQVPADLFLRLKPNKYVLIAKAGAVTPTESIAKYKAKSVTCLFVKIEDYRRLIVATVRAAGDMVGVKDVGESSRMTVIQEAMEAVYREISDLGFDEDSYSHAKLVNHATLVYVLENPGLADLLGKYGQLMKDGTKHSMMVSMVATMLGMGHEWVKPATLEKLSLGGFLHDLGKTKIPSSILEKPLSRMSRDERIIYESHCEVGRQTLLQARTVPDDIVSIVFEHHERSDGSGFPRQLKDFQINPLARVVALANCFVDRVYTQDGPFTNDTARQVFDEIELTMAGKFNKDALRVLRRLLFEKGLQAAG